MFANQIAELKLLILNGDKKYVGVLEHLKEMFEFDKQTYAGILQEMAKVGIKKEQAAFYEKAVSVLPKEAIPTYIALYKLYSGKDLDKVLKELSTIDLVFLGDDIRVDVYNECLYQSFFVMDTDIIDAFVTKLNEAGGN